jgi:hypothetical protein
MSAADSTDDLDLVLLFAEVLLKEEKAAVKLVQNVLKKVQSEGRFSKLLWDRDVRAPADGRSMWRMTALVFATRWRRIAKLSSLW